MYISFQQNNLAYLLFRKEYSTAYLATLMHIPVTTGTFFSNAKRFRRHSFVIILWLAAAATIKNKTIYA